MSYVVKISKSDYAELITTGAKSVLIIRKALEQQEKDKTEIKLIKKAIKKLDDATLVGIVKYTKMSRSKIVRVLNEQDHVFWVGETATGRVGKPTKIYKRIKK